MRTSDQITRECDHIYTPNAGIKALAKEAYHDPDSFCIMDGEGSFTESYRCECPDREKCHRDDYMLACVQTRSPGYAMGDKAVKIYNEAMGLDEKGVERSNDYNVQ